MAKDTLKFFHAYINEMIEVGGENLPRAVSTKLGAKLAGIYKRKGIKDLDSALKTAYKALGASAKINYIDTSTISVKLKHSKRFCPIGGKRNPNQAETIHKSICYPYTKSFLANLFPEFSFDAEITKCILVNSNSHCEYILNLKPKENLG